MTLPGPVTPLPPTGDRRTWRARWSTNPAAWSPLPFSLVWVAGVGSVIGLVLGSGAVKRSTRLSGTRDGRGAARAGNAVGLVGVVVAVLFRSSVAGLDATSSPSYFDGYNSATMDYPNATTEASLCQTTYAQSYDNPMQWLKGFRDGWYVASRGSHSAGMPGLNV